MIKISFRCFAFLVAALSATTVLEAQDQDQWENTSTKWSVSVFYSPHLSFPLGNAADNKPGFIGGAGVLVNRRQNNERVSFSFGSIYRHRTIDESQQSTTAKETFIEFPVQVNYHLLKDAVKYDPYLRSSVKIAYLKYRYPHYNDPGGISLLSGIDYPLSIDFGYGVSVRLIGKLSLITEFSLGYRLAYHKPDRYNFSALSGLNYIF